MAPESIKDGQWGIKSDVWAFGITLWEAWSAGAVPYSDVTSDNDLSSQVVEGMRYKKKWFDSKVLN